MSDVIGSNELPLMDPSVPPSKAPESPAMNAEMQKTSTWVMLTVAPLALSAIEESEIPRSRRPRRLLTISTTSSATSSVHPSTT